VLSSAVTCTIYKHNSHWIFSLSSNLTCLQNSEGDKPQTQPQTQSYSQPPGVSVPVGQVQSEPGFPRCDHDSNSNPSDTISGSGSGSGSSPGSGSGPCSHIYWRYVSCPPSGRTWKVQHSQTISHHLSVTLLHISPLAVGQLSVGWRRSAACFAPIVVAPTRPPQLVTPHLQEEIHVRPNPQETQKPIQHSVSLTDKLTGYFV